MEWSQGWRHPEALQPASLALQDLEWLPPDQPVHASAGEAASP
ncbi:hypothetical protein BH23PSE2_BH23PSE2_08950 [soil metagenome]